MDRAYTRRPQQLTCPFCREAMQIAKLERNLINPQLKTYECTQCRVEVTKEAA